VLPLGTGKISASRLCHAWQRRIQKREVRQAVLVQNRIGGRVVFRQACAVAVAGRRANLRRTRVDRTNQGACAVRNVVVQKAAIQNPESRTAGRNPVQKEQAWNARRNHAVGQNAQQPLGGAW